MAFIIPIALCILFLVYRNRKNRRLLNVKYQEALSRLEGKNFFCYNNKNEVIDAIQTVIIPQLSPGIEIIFLNGKDPESDYEQWVIRKIFYDFKGYSKFPHLFKIRNRQIIECSINNEFYNTIDQKKPLANFFRIINKFFED